MSDKNLRKNLIRVASELPQGSEERKTLLSILQEDAAPTKQADGSPDEHQKKILMDTVRNPLKGKFLGGPTAEEAERTLRKKFRFTDRQIARLKQASEVKQAAAVKSRSVPVKLYLSGKRIVPAVDGDPAMFEGFLSAPDARAAVKVSFSYDPRGSLVEYMKNTDAERFVESLVDSIMKADPTYLDKKKW
tara:strand:+ start:490 stop:1059 length:570 start_codon:yes stop_codon:yes gene_type:complete